jgi:hypothetical protein
MNKINKKNSVEDSNEILTAIEEAHAYTPGLKIKWVTSIYKERRLPLKGDVLVSLGKEVTHDLVVAKTLYPGDIHVVNAANILGIQPVELKDHLIKEIGENVKKEEPLAIYKAFFGIINRKALSPAEGTIDTYSDVTGQIVIQEKEIPILIDAYIPGEVVEILPNEGAVIKTRGSLIQGIFGIGGETHGLIKKSVSSPSEVLDENKISENDNNKILIGGSKLTYNAFKKAVNVGVKGIIVGSIDYIELEKIIGRKIGVAITGMEDIGLTLILTEGFGHISMAQKTFEILTHFEGLLASINGETQIRAGVIRPEVVIPHNESFGKEYEEILSQGIQPGTKVRIIRQPYFGEIGKVIELPIDLERIESRSKVRVFTVQLESSGKKITVPRTNVEIIEE